MAAKVTSKEGIHQFYNVSFRITNPPASTVILL